MAPTRRATASCKISSTQDVRFSYGAIEEGRKLAIKLWNVSAADPPECGGRDSEPWRRATSRSAGFWPDRGGAGRDRGAWERFDFAASTATLYHLVFDDFCDWYAEAIKPRLYDSDPDATATALMR